MLFGISIFALGFVGLAALFLCKALELRRAVITPLHALRKNGDHLVTEKWKQLKEKTRRRAIGLFYTSCATCKNGAHEAATRFHASLHSFSVRLGEYLKRNGATGEKNGRASSYVKDMLEYKLNAERTPVVEQSSLRGTARTDADLTQTEQRNSAGDTHPE